jgi:hypothetical protein
MGGFERARGRRDPMSASLALMTTTSCGAML